MKDTPMTDAKPITISADEYAQMTPWSQGYTSYMQSARNKEVPKRCPYTKGTPEYRAWAAGECAAMFEVQECDS